MDDTRSGTKRVGDQAQQARRSAFSRRILLAAALELLPAPALLLPLALPAVALAQMPESSCTGAGAHTLHAPATAATQLTTLPAGVTLPVLLGRTLRAGTSKVGTDVTARTTQRVPVGPDTYLPRGAQLTGTVTRSEAGTDGRPAVLGLRFTELRLHNQQGGQPIVIAALALANMTDVQATAAPVAGFADTINPSASNWTTEQVGGDEVYRSDWTGPVCNNVMRRVGFADFAGIYSLPGEPLGGVALPFARALGVFSSAANGAYGLGDGATVSSAGGEILVRSPERHLTLYGEDHLLLETVAAAR